MGSRVVLARAPEVIEVRASHREKGRGYTNNPSAEKGGPLMG